MDTGKDGAKTPSFQPPFSGLEFLRLRQFAIRRMAEPVGPKIRFAQCPRVPSCFAHSFKPTSSNPVPARCAAGKRWARALAIRQVRWRSRGSRRDDALHRRAPPIPRPAKWHPREGSSIFLRWRAREHWANGLHRHGYAGGSSTSPAALYQERVAGYPEYDLPLPNGKVVQADGLRAQDGAIVEAKYVNAPGTGCTPRTLENLSTVDPDKNTPWLTKPYDTDDGEAVIKFASRAEADEMIATLQIADVHAKLQQWVPDAVSLSY